MILVLDQSKSTKSQAQLSIDSEGGCVEFPNKNQAKTDFLVILFFNIESAAITLMIAGDYLSKKGTGAKKMDLIKLIHQLTAIRIQNK